MDLKARTRPLRRPIHKEATPFAPTEAQGSGTQTSKDCFTTEKIKGALYEAGTFIDHFCIIRYLKRGGMGEIYLALDTKLGRKVALKMIAPHMLGSSQAISQFLDEARSTALFNHPHIVTLYYVGEYQEKPYVALEYLDGHTLRTHLENGPLPLSEALHHGLAIAKALEEAHARGILHRDLKPENVMIPRDGRLRVLDFGLAKRLKDAREAVVPGSPCPHPHCSRTPREAFGFSANFEGDNDFGGNSPPPLDLEIPPIYPTTSKGEVNIFEGGAGTPEYMAPEQWQFSPPTAASDMWAFGVVLYEMVSGKRPFSHAPSAELVYQTCGPIPTPRLPKTKDIPSAISDLISRCLKKSPQKRPSASEAAAILEKVLESFQTQAWSSEKCPFRGLLPYHERHGQIFFGRESETRAFIERLRDTSLLPVIGPSGIGKSSFVRAGVLALLKAQGSWLPIELRPGREPFWALADAVLRQIGASRRGSWSTLKEELGFSANHFSNSPATTPKINEKLNSNSAHPINNRSATNPKIIENINATRVQELAEELYRSPRRLAWFLMHIAQSLKMRVLLFVDQLEELYTQVECSESRRRFITALRAAGDDAPSPVRVIFTLRDDYFSRLADSFEGMTTIDQVTILGKPDGAALSKILTTPLALAGYRYEDPEMVEEMIREIVKEPASLPLLQITAKMLWDRRDEKKRLLRRSVYQSIGGVCGAMAYHADRVLLGFNPQQRQLARQLLLRLLSPEGMRKALDREKLLDDLPQQASLVLDRLIHGRLVIIRRDSQKQREQWQLELVHESLLASWKDFARWFEESRDDLVFLREAGEDARKWSARGKNRDNLWRGRQLKEGLEALNRCHQVVPSFTLEFLQTSRKSERRNVWLKRLSALFIGIFLVGLAIFFYLQKEIVNSALSKATKERQRAEVGLAEAQREGAFAAFHQGHLLQARAKLRSSLERQDSQLTRALFWQLQKESLRWKKLLGDAILDVAFAPDGENIAAACQNKTIYIIDKNTMKLRNMRTFSDQILAIAFYPDDSQKIALATWSGKVWLWDTARSSVTALKGSAPGARWLTFSPDGKYLAAGGYQGKIHIYTLTERSKTISIQAHHGNVYGLAFSRDGKWLASGGFDRTVRLFDVAQMKQVKVFRGHKKGVFGVDFDPQGKWLATAGYDGTIRIFDILSGKILRTIYGHSKPVYRISFSPDGKLLASSSFDRTVRLFKVSDGRPVGMTAKHAHAVLGLSFSPDGRYLATGSRDRTLRLFEVAKANTTSLQGHRAGVFDVAFTHDGEHLVSAGGDGQIGLWERQSGRPIQMLKGPSGRIYDIALDSQNQYIAAAGIDKTIRLWRIRQDTLLSPSNRDGEQVPKAPHDPLSRAQKTHHYQDAPAHLLSGHEGPIYQVAFSPDGRYIASASGDKKVHLWEAFSTKLLRVFRGHQSDVYSVAFSPRGDLLVSAGADHTIRLWAVKTGNLLRVFRGHRGAVWDICFSPDGSQLASASTDGSLRIWQVSSGRLIAQKHHPGRVYAVAFSPRGDIIGTACSDGNARLWRTGSTIPLVLRGHRGEVNSIAFSSNGRWVATSSDDGTIRLWNANTAEPQWKAPALLASSQEFFTQKGWQKSASLFQRSARSLAPFPTGKKKNEHQYVSRANRKSAHKCVSRANRKNAHRYVSTNESQQWRGAIEKQALLVRESKDKRWLCLHTHEMSLELWDRKHDKRLWVRSAPRLDQFEALFQGCVVLAQGEVDLFLSAKNHQRLAIKATAIAADTESILVAQADRVLVFDRRGQLIASHRVGYHVRTMLQTKRGLYVGFDDGSLAFFPLQHQIKATPLFFQGTPSSPVTRLLLGPNRTLIAGFENGFLGLFSAQDGSLLHHSQNHGAILHLSIDHHRLIALTELGGVVSWDLNIFRQDYCHLLKEVWKKIPVVWEQGKLIVKAPPFGHACRKKW